MTQCVSCGVLLEDKAKTCPLCGRPVGEGQEGLPPEPVVDEVKRAKEAKRRRLLAMESYSVVSGIAAILCLGIDLWASRGGLGWSLYCLVGIAMAWLFVAMPLIFIRKPWLIVATLAPGELLLLLLLNVVDLSKGGPGWWFLSYGLPIYVLTLGVFLGAIVLGLVSKVKGLNIAGIVLAAAALECLGLETVISLAGGLSLSYNWSPVVALSCVPASGLAFYFHYRVMKRPIRRSLHL